MEATMWNDSFMLLIGFQFNSEGLGAVGAWGVLDQGEGLGH